MQFAITASLACLNTLIYGAVALVVIRHFSPGKSARFGAFCIALGFAIGNFAGHSGADPEVVLLERLAGSAIALTVLWFCLLRQPSHAPLQESQQNRAAAP